MTPFLGRYLALTSLLTLTIGCGASATPQANGGNGGGSGGAVGTGGSGSGGTSSGSGGASGGSGGASTGTGGASGSGGASDTDGGSGGNVVADGGPKDMPAGGETAPAGTKGIQGDPGTMGDGTIPQPPPYPAPPETMGRVGGAPAGMMSPWTIYASKAIYPGMKFQYAIHVPAQYQKGKPAALMVFFDGQHYGGPNTPNAAEDYHWNAPFLIENLIHTGDMPVTISVYIDPGTPSGIFHRRTQPDDGLRGQQYDTPSDAHSRFLLNEFLPDVILNKYDIVDDPEGWALAGHSSGGICAFMITWYRPDKFRKSVTSSASFSNTGGRFPAAITQLAGAPKPIRTTLLSGTNDLTGNPSWLTANTQAADALKAKGYHYRFRTGVDNHTPPLASINESIEAYKWVWRNYKLPWYP
ncbi:MAG TPA: alpha/beta hydrolase-fold protein [Polyangia bacterium]|nr:alpha/beta hydrolase-fold protein [Polyangia bacterium]